MNKEELHIEDPSFAVDTSFLDANVDEVSEGLLLLVRLLLTTQQRKAYTIACTCSHQLHVLHMNSEGQPHKPRAANLLVMQQMTNLSVIPVQQRHLQRG